MRGDRAHSTLSTDPTRPRASRGGAHRRARGVALALLVGMTLAAAQPAAAAGYEDGLAIAFDVAVLRPLNAAALALGTIFFAVSAPLVAPSGGVATAWDVFVYAPYEYTVLRDLGDF